MPQLILLALAGVGAYATYKWLRKKVQASNAAVAQRRQEQQTGGAARDLGSLQRDPNSGEYRPK